jgi:predicted transcriptional regulator
MGKYSKKFIKEEEVVKKDKNGNVVERKVRTWSLSPAVDSDFIKFFDAFVMDLLQDEEIAGKSIRLLFYIASILDYDDEIFYLSPTEVAKELNVNKSTVFRWLKTLLDKGLIIKTNRRNWYMINKRCVYKGSVIRADIEELEKTEREVKYGTKRANRRNSRVKN